jgi:hypothetical protein
MFLNLPSIHSEEENAKIRDLADWNWVWIGLKKAVNGSFVWSDGSQLDYERWAPEQKFDNENKCVYLRPALTGNWFVTPCLYTYRYLCK